MRRACRALTSPARSIRTPPILALAEWNRASPPKFAVSSKRAATKCWSTDRGAMARSPRSPSTRPAGSSAEPPHRAAASPTSWGAESPKGVSGAAAELRVQPVAQRVAQEIEREHRQEDGHARANAHPPHQIAQVALVV